MEKAKVKGKKAVTGCQAGAKRESRDREDDASKGNGKKVAGGGQNTGDSV